MTVSAAALAAAVDAWSLRADVDPAASRLSHLAAILARQLGGIVDILRLDLIDGTDGKGTAVRIELETARVITVLEVRPSSARVNLDDVENLGDTRNRKAARVAQALMADVAIGEV